MTPVSARSPELANSERVAIMDRAQGAYLGLAVGDALGSTVEFMTPGEIREAHGMHKDLIGGGWLRLRPGRVTDDTEMSLALGRAILSEEGFRPSSIAEQFDAWLKSKPVDVGHTVRRGIMRFRTHGTTLSPMDPYDAGNGAVMRVLPVALATLGASMDEIERAALMQAHVTHNAPLADVGMLAVVEMTQRALRGGGDAYRDMVVLAHRLRDQAPEYDFTKRPQNNPGGFLPETLRAVMQAFLRTDNFESALVDVVNRGGDADTTGAILGFMAGALHGAAAIPARWTRDLDPSVRKHCEMQARALLEMCPLLSGRPVRFILD
ncbi:MAG: ADP-ribosyl-[dinitrogen reductase] hydrolase [Alphaproteobacteria bacterium]|nr:ADP-ribosyl-[dinitrogen reductase] hydrolase [Alphaproteobacteria bacterium]